jgi:hypothetical protein
MLACVDAVADFNGKRLDDYDFSHTNFCQAKLHGISMRCANFHQAILAGADLSGAHLEGANFCRTDLYETIFRNAKLRHANLQGVQLARTDLRGADLRDCKCMECRRGISSSRTARNRKTDNGISAHCQRFEHRRNCRQQPGPGGVHVPDQDNRNMQVIRRQCMGPDPWTLF